MAQDFDNRRKPSDVDLDTGAEGSLHTPTGAWSRVDAAIRLATGQENGTVIADYDELPLEVRVQFDDALASSQAIGYTDRK
jgi:hypothetical protein